MTKCVKHVKKTSDGMAILDAITAQDSKMQALIEEEAETLKIAKSIYDLRTKARLSQNGTGWVCRNCRTNRLTA